MNWMQAYEVGACVLLFFACVSFNLGVHVMPRLTRICTTLLGISAIVRGAGLVAKYAELTNLSKATIAAADGNIPLLTAVALASIVWHQIKCRTQQNECERGSSDAR